MDKIDKNSLIKWVIKHKENIKRIYNKEIDLRFFILFLRFSKNPKDISGVDGLYQIEKDSIGIPFDIWIDEGNYYKKRKIPISIICTNNREFLGVVNVIDPKQYIFTKERLNIYKSNANIITEWIKKYRQYIIDTSRCKMYGTELHSMMEYDYITADNK
jgi:hypothetical protein